MLNILLVAVGGAFGAVCRHLLSGAALRLLGPGTIWNYGTFTANIFGSLLMGFLAGWLAFRVDGGAQWRILLGTGVLGGFTTFSSYSLETALMIERRQYLPAAGYSLGSLVLGVAALFIGLWAARRLLG